MKQPKRWLAPALVLLLVVGCGRVSPTLAPTAQPTLTVTVPAASPTEPPTSPTDTASGTTQPPLADLFSADYATDALLATLDTYDEFSEEDWAEAILIQAHATLKEFNYVALDFVMDEDSDADDASPEYRVSRVLFSTGELLPEKPLVIHSLISEIIPSRGISFVDTSGRTQYFIFGISGKDGSLVVGESSPFTPATKP